MVTMAPSLNNFNNLKEVFQELKFHLVRIDVKFIHTNFGGRGLFNFGDTAALKNGHFSLSDHGL